MLVAAAARHWSVAPESLRTENGQVFNGGKSLRYGALADAASKEPSPEKVTLKDPASGRLRLEEGCERTPEEIIRELIERLRPQPAPEPPGKARRAPRAASR